MISNEKREEIEKQAEKLLGFRVWKNEESATGFKYQEQIWVDHCRPAMANEIKSWQTVISLLDRLTKARETLGKYGNEEQYKLCLEKDCQWEHPHWLTFIDYEPAQQCLAEIGGEGE